MRTALLLCALLVAGCGKKSDASASAESAPPEKAVSSETVNAPAAEVDLSKTLNRLTQAVRRYAAEMRTAPKSLDELVAAGYLPEIPGAPPGKKFVIDDQLRVTLK
jgi:hypothetical protein